MRCPAEGLRLAAPRRRVLPPLSALLLLLTLLGGLAEARVKLGPTPYRDPVHKFSLKVFDDFEQVPLGANEKVLVAKFGIGKSKGGAIQPGLKIFRINKRDGGEIPTITGPGAEAYRRRMAAQNPKSAWAAAMRELQFRYRIPKDKLPKKDTFKTVKSKEKIEGRLWSFTVPIGTDGRGKPIAMFAALIAFERDDIEYGLFLVAPEKEGKKSYARELKRLAGSFRFFDKKAKDVKELDVLDGVNITAERRREIEKGMIKGWNVIVSPKKQYVVLYNTVNGRNNQLAREIARRIELIRAQIYEKQFPPTHPIDAVSVVRVCGDKTEYHRYGGPGGSAGYWNSGSEELVFYDASRSKKIDDNTVAVLYHEAFHQYIFYSTGDVAPHSWFNEGHGDYYSGAELKGRSFKIKPFAWRRQTIKTAATKGPREKIEVEAPDGTKHTRYANDGGYTPLVDLVHFTQREYYSYPGISYAQGWSFIYFLREVVPKNRKYRQKWGHILDTYFDTLQAAVSGQPLPERARLKPPDDDGKSKKGGKGKKGKEPEGKEGEKEEEEPEAWIPPPSQGRRGGKAALEKAVSAAFAGVDFDELEAAWRKAVTKDM